MIISRSSALMKLNGLAGRNLLQNRVTRSLENTRQSHETRWAYRKVPPPHPKHSYFNYYGGVFIWWWVTWHLVTDYDELLGRSFPDPSKWTDEELGIPPI